MGCTFTICQQRPCPASPAPEATEFSIFVLPQAVARQRRPRLAPPQWFLPLLLGLLLSTALASQADLHDSIIHHDDVVVKSSKLLDEDPNAPPLRAASDTIFEAYSCGSPHNIRDVSYQSVGNCPPPVVPTVERENITVQVLFNQKTLEIPAIRCYERMSQDIQYCGHYDHQTVYPYGTMRDVPVPVTTSDCSRWSTKLQASYGAVGPGPGRTGGRINLQWNEEVNHLFQPVGRTWVTEQGEVKCSGQPFRQDAEVGGASTYIADAVVSQHSRYFLGNETLRYDADGVVKTVTSGVTLPCSIATNGCETDAGTFVWQPPRDTCRLGLTRYARGNIVVHGEQRVFMSNDGSLIRLILEGKTKKCNREVWGTNFKRVFVLEVDQYTTPFVNLIKNTELSFSSYIRARDDAIYENLKEYVTGEFNYVLQQECQQKRLDHKVSWFHQYTNPGIVTFLLGNGTYGTTAGEVMYIYECDAVPVRAVETAECFDSLPVQLLDLNNHTQLKSSPDRSEVVFMEPITRRLSKQGIQRPCSRVFKPKYKDSFSTWFAVSPGVHRTSTPDAFTNFMDYQPTDSPYRAWLESNITGGGLFTVDELEEKEHTLDWGRSKSALVAQLISQMPTHGYVGGRVAFNDIFGKQDELHEKYLPWDLWAIVTRWLERVGSTASVFVSLVLIGSVIWKLVSCLHSAHILHAAYGCGKQMLWLLCLDRYVLRSTVNNRNYRVSARQAQNYEMERLAPQSSPRLGGTGGRRGGRQQ